MGWSGLWSDCLWEGSLRLLCASGSGKGDQGQEDCGGEEQKERKDEPLVVWCQGCCRWELPNEEVFTAADPAIGVVFKKGGGGRGEEGGEGGGEGKGGGGGEGGL